MVNVAPPLVPPPNAGLKTFTAAVPAVFISADGTVAVSDLLPTNVVGRFEPFH